MKASEQKNSGNARKDMRTFRKQKWRQKLRLFYFVYVFTKAKKGEEKI
jgi:hypothetical protein